MHDHDKRTLRPGIGRLLLDARRLRDAVGLPNPWHSSQRWKKRNMRCDGIAEYSPHTQGAAQSPTFIASPHIANVLEVALEEVADDGSEVRIWQLDFQFRG